MKNFVNPVAEVRKDVSRAGQAIATDPLTGQTIMVWNEGGQVYAAYYNLETGHWIDGEAIPASASGEGLDLVSNVAILGPDGKAGSGLVATWTVGQGNDAETVMSVGQASPLGGYSWSVPIAVTSDAVMDDHAILGVGPDGAAVLVTRKSDAGNPAGDSDLHAVPLVIDGRHLTYGATAPRSVLASDLPAVDGFGVVQSGAAFDFGLKFSSEPKILPARIPLLGGKDVKIEVDIRVRGGMQEGDPRFSGLEGYDLAGLLRGEIKFTGKFFDMVTLSGYAQGMFFFGTADGGAGETIDFIGGRMIGGAQAKVEYAPPGWRLSFEAGAIKIGVEAGMAFDIRTQTNSIWEPVPKDEGAAAVTFDFARIVRADGGSAHPGDNPADLNWQIDLSRLAPLMIGSLFAEAAAAAPEPVGDGEAASVDLRYTHQYQFSPGAGLYAKAKFSSGLEGKVSAIAYFDFTLEGKNPFSADWYFRDFRQRLDAELKVGLVTTRYRYEKVETLDGAEGVERGYRTIGYEPLPGSADALAPGSVFGAHAGADTTNDGRASIAVAADGRLVMAWVKDAPNDSADLSYVVVSESTDGGRTWSTPEVVPGSAGLNIEPVVGFDAAGRTVVSWGQGDGSHLTDQPPGRAYVIFGGAGLAGAGTVALGALDGASGFGLVGGAPVSAIGGAVAGLGDMNGDGVADIAIAAPDAAIDAGLVYVVFGGAAVGAGGTVDVDALDGVNGFVLEGAPYSQLGTGVAGVGDINGDGYDDLLVGAPGGGGSVPGAGAAYVVYGGAHGFGVGGKLDVAALDGTNGFRIDTGVALDAVGASVGGGGDLNGDGIADLVIGAPGASGDAGAYYVVFGGAGLGHAGRMISERLPPAAVSSSPTAARRPPASRRPCRSAARRRWPPTSTATASATSSSLPKGRPSWSLAARDWGLAVRSTSSSPGCSGF